MRNAGRAVVAMLLGIVAESIFAQAPATAPAQAYPTRPLRIIVGSSPGGGSDQLARLLAPKLGEGLGHQVVVENRAGASGILGADIVAKSAPDGHTLLVSQASLAINPSMHPKMPYDTLRDLAPI
jgi:tripartite-type tricarboxylate transporter receptor subunit TctC